MASTSASKIKLQQTISTRLWTGSTTTSDAHTSGARIRRPTASILHTIQSCMTNQATCSTRQAQTSKKKKSGKPHDRPQHRSSAVQGRKSTQPHTPTVLSPRFFSRTATNIIIEADKNLGPCIMEQEAYIQRCIEEHLGDSAT